MYQCHGYIRDYNPAADTATVELVGVGIVDTWITGMKVHAALNRGELAGGIPVVLEMPDPHRICEATIVSLWDTVANQANGSGATLIQTGRATIGTDGTGTGSLTVTYPTPYTGTIPTVTATCDGRVSSQVTGVSLTQFTIKITGALAQATYKFTWSSTNGP